MAREEGGGGLVQERNENAVSGSVKLQRLLEAKIYAARISLSGTRFTGHRYIV